MNYRLIASSLVALAVSASIGFAIDPFPKQPKLSAAYNKLTSALGQLERSRIDDAPKHRKNALTDLAMAKNFLDDAAKNKGSYGPAAIASIDQATKELEITPGDTKNTDEAIGMIKKALDQISRGAHAARH